MELRDSVGATLMQIIEGVKDAREAVAKMPAALQPRENQQHHGQYQ
jgi:hypothetical protein